MKNIFLLLGVLVFCLICGFLRFKDLEASDYEAEELRCYTHNVPAKASRNGVKRVALVVSHASRLYGEERLPKIIQKSELEQIFKSLYTEFFKVHEGYKPGCYGQNNQPVEIFDYNNQRKEVLELSKTPGVLVAYIQVTVQEGKRIGYKEGEDFISFYIHNIRADDFISDFQEITYPAFFPLSLSDEEMQGRIEQYFKNSIR